jgi:biotin carboxylase
VDDSQQVTRSRVLLLLFTATYKAQDFLEAAGRLPLEVVVGTERRQALESMAPGHTLTLPRSSPETSVRRICDLHARAPLRAIVGVDDETAVLAAMAAEALGLPHNSVASARAARDKHETRRLLAAAGLRCPAFRLVPIDDPPAQAAQRVTYPCVLKPLSLSASRGVLRADNPREFVEAFQRIAAILQADDVREKGDDTSHLLVEDYLPGGEVALEGLLEGGRLRVLALFDKPDPLEGPTFEETLYVTPSRLQESLQQAIAEETARGCRALGLREGPIHAELRLHRGRPWLLEVAARSIGGLCARTLRFGAGISLEELILRHAMGLESSTLTRENRAAGVMMIPVPRAGVLRGVQGLEEARALPGIEEVTLTLHRGAKLVPLPEGHRYLGFIFARDEGPDEVERDLRDAHRLLRFSIA